VTSLTLHETLVVVLSTGGSPLDETVLGELPDATALWVRVERERQAACLAARFRHPDPPAQFRDRVRRWGASRGWTVAVAPFPAVR